MRRKLSSPNHRPRISQTERQRWIAQYQQSGLSAVEFATRHGLSPWTLRRWGTQVRQPQQAMAPTVQEVQVDWSGISSADEQWAAEVRWPSGTVLRWKRSLLGQELRLVLNALSGTC